MGGGVVSAELTSPSRSSDVPDAAGDVEEWSLPLVLAEPGGVDTSWFIPTRTEAASSS